MLLAKYQKELAERTKEDDNEEEEDKNRRKRLRCWGTIQQRTNTNLTFHLDFYVLNPDFQINLFGFLYEKFMVSLWKLNNFI